MQLMLLCVCMQHVLPPEDNFELYDIGEVWLKMQEVVSCLRGLILGPMGLLFARTCHIDGNISRTDAAVVE